MSFAVLAAFTGSEFIWIAIAVLVLFGAKKVPELMRGVGQGIKEFKKATRDVQDEVHRALEESEAPPKSPTQPKKSEYTVPKQPDYSEDEAMHEEPKSESIASPTVVPVESSPDSGTKKDA
jgi:sec-independent protein translocase protein TatA